MDFFLSLGYCATAVLHGRPRTLMLLLYVVVQTPPVTDTDTVDMPVPLHPACLDVCGCMVALGTREGPVILFDVGPRDARRTGPPPMQIGKRPRRETISSASGHGDSSGDGSGGSTRTSVTRVYGSLADGTGPISSVILDRAKLIAAGRGSRRNGGGYVIR